MKFALKKRDKFWIKRLILLIFCFFGFVLFSFINILFFSQSYMEEEKEELHYLKKQIEWTITPFLKNKDFKSIKKYCEDFNNDDFRFRIFDNNNNLIASSRPDEIEKMLDSNSEIFQQRKGILKIYRHFIKDKKIGLLEKLNVENTSYYIEITISEEDVLKSITTAQQIIYISFFIFLIFIIWSFYYVLNRIRIPFNHLEDSLIKIANGELDTDINIQKNDILHELSIAIKKMAVQLKNQITKLKELEEYRSTFIENISHEIKTPITAINMAIELIENEKDKNLSIQNMECLNIISTQINYLNSLINDILSLAELEGEKPEKKENFTYFVINNLIKKVIEYNNSTNIKINIIEKDIINIFADEDLIYRAISNILINAVKYSKSETIDIYINKQDNLCILQIIDYGIGIHESHIKKVFEKFYRVDKSRSRQKGGTGLGLAIVKKIIELHKGSIDLKSEQNKGCNFTIKLPTDG